MQQLEIQYFFPFTEQIPLALDFTPSEDYERAKRNLVTTTTLKDWLITNGATATTIVSYAPTLEFISSPKSVGYWLVTESLHIWRETKPNWLHRKYTEFILGWKWKDK
jgi:hypothetical protein